LKNSSGFRNEGCVFYIVYEKLGRRCNESTAHTAEEEWLRSTTIGITAHKRTIFLILNFLMFCISFGEAPLD